ncbi:unnamed protein product [Absidia cylindrospora]
MSSNSISDTACIKEITSAISKYKDDTNSANLRDIILELGQVLFKNHKSNGTVADFRSQWKLRIVSVGDSMGVKIYGNFTPDLYKILVNGTPLSQVAPLSAPSVPGEGSSSVVVTRGVVVCAADPPFSLLRLLVSSSFRELDFSFSLVGVD